MAPSRIFNSAARLIAIHLLISLTTAALLGSAIYWDDWVIIGVQPQLVIERFAMAGTPFAWTGRLLASITQSDLLTQRLLLAALWLVICGLFGLIVYRNGAAKPIALVAALLALVAPFNSARNALINMPALLCVGAFFIGWVSLPRNIWLATPAFLLSFTLPSLLFLYAAPFLEYAIQRLRDSSWRQPANASRLIWLAALPPGYWLAKMLWLAPSGIYEGYNATLSLQNVLVAGKLVVLDAAHIVRHLHWGWYLALAAASAALWPTARVLTQATREAAANQPSLGRLVVCGLALLVLGSLPYLLTGNPPRWAVWDSRNQVLLPFGCALLVLALLKWLTPAHAARCLALLMAGSLLYWTGQGYTLWRDAQKQQQIIQLWAQDPAVAQAHIVILDDRSGVPFANRRLPGWYELSGMLASGYDNERRIGIEISQWTNDLCEPLEHFRFRTPFYRTGGVRQALSETGPGLHIVRSTLLAPPDQRGWIARLLHPVQGLQMTTERVHDHCIGAEADRKS